MIATCAYGDNYLSLDLDIECCSLFYFTRDSRKLAVYNNGWEGCTDFDKFDSGRTWVYPDQANYLCEMVRWEMYALAHSTDCSPHEVIIKARCATLESDGSVWGHKIDHKNRMKNRRLQNFRAVG